MKKSAQNKVKIMKLCMLDIISVAHYINDLLSFFHFYRKFHSTWMSSILLG